MTMVKYEHDTVTREFTDRSCDVRSVIVRRQRPFGNILAVPHRSGTRAEHVCTEHHRHCCHHKSRPNSYRPGAALIGEPQNNQHEHVQCDRATRATASRAHNKYLHALLGAHGGARVHKFLVQRLRMRVRASVSFPLWVFSIRLFVQLEERLVQIQAIFVQIRGALVQIRPLYPTD